MTQVTRRNFIKLAGLGVLSGIAASEYTLPTIQAIPSGTRQYQGNDLSGWAVVVGDGIYAAPGEPSVNQNDIETVNYGTYSELRANILKRRIMAHNITYQRIIDSNAFDFVYIFECKFMLPYMPSTSRTDLNAQTLEGGLFIWDGSTTRLDYGMGFQWGLNPWDKFGEMRCWTDIGGGQWQPVGYLEPDLSWHTLKIVFDFRRQMTTLMIDEKHYPSCFTGTPKPADWGTEIAAGVQIEIISVYPGEQGNGALHKAYFKDWYWLWEPSSTCQLFLPMIAK